MSRRSASLTPSLFGQELEQFAELQARRPEQGAQAGGAELCAKVALNKPMRVEFSYSVPAAFAAGLAPGMRVLVPFGRAREIGVISELTREPGVERSRLKSIVRVLDSEPVVDQRLLDLTRWMASNYACAWGEALAAILPAPLKRERSARRVLVVSPTPAAREIDLAVLEAEQPKQHRLLRTLFEIEGAIGLTELLRKLNLTESPARTLEKRGLVLIRAIEKKGDELLEAQSDRPRHSQLSPPQAEAVKRIDQAVRDQRHEAFLLQGVTGSGKTEVYLRAIENALALGRGAIVLVPEIALTPQTVGWFRSRFGKVALLHSRMTDAQRLEMWRAAQRGEARVVVGARSAVFAPVPRLGVIVVDEEHEPSFKQGSVPRYHARDVALERARLEGAVCVLGSATPALESWHAAGQGTLTHLCLPRRVGGGALPSVRIVDMRHERADRQTGGLFSLALREALQEVRSRGEQALLFQNRRGFAPVLYCPGCQRTLRCRHCDLSLTFHKRIQRLLCHACCEELSVPQTCPGCGHKALRFLGTGSERVEGVLGAFLPGARIKRMDSDTMLRREDYETTLEAFGRGEIDIIVGTQMIAKGLDFPRVTLVGIISADSSLHLPDFRASERTFQLISQVAGRAGRGELPGRIIVQTQTPGHPAIAHAARHDFESFAREELELREELDYPPFGRLLRALFEDEELPRVEAAAKAAAESLRKRLDPALAQVLGPAPAPMALLRGRHRAHILIKLPGSAAALSEARELLLELGLASARPRIAVDVDPVSML